MRTTGASCPAACTVATIVPSGAASMRYHTVASIRPHFDTCGSSRSTVASTVVPWVDAGNDGRSWASALLSFGGGASAGATSASATNAVSTAPTSFVFRAPGSYFLPHLSRFGGSDHVGCSLRRDRAGPGGGLAGDLRLRPGLAAHDDRYRDEHERGPDDDPRRDRLVQEDRTEGDRDHRVDVGVRRDLAERRVREQPRVRAVAEQRPEHDQVPEAGDRTSRIPRRGELVRAVDRARHGPQRDL